MPLSQAAAEQSIVSTTSTGISRQLIVNAAPEPEVRGDFALSYLGCLLMLLRFPDGMSETPLYQHSDTTHSSLNFSQNLCVHTYTHT